MSEDDWPSRANNWSPPAIGKGVVGAGAGDAMTASVGVAAVVARDG